VVGAVDQRNFHVDHRITSENAVLQRFLHALLDRGDVLARHPATLDGVDELVALAVGLRLELEPDVAVLPAAARLLDELALGLERLLEGLAIGDLRLADGGLDANSRFMRSTMIRGAARPCPK